MKLNSQPTQFWMMKLKNIQLKRTQKCPELTQVNLLSTILGSWGQNN